MKPKHRFLFILLGLLNLLGGLFLLGKGEYFISTDRVFNEAWDNEGVFVMIIFGAVLLFYGIKSKKTNL